MVQSPAFQIYRLYLEKSAAVALLAALVAVSPVFSNSSNLAVVVEPPPLSVVLSLSEPQPARASATTLGITYQASFLNLKSIPLFLVEVYRVLFSSESRRHTSDFFHLSATAEGTNPYVVGRTIGRRQGQRCDMETFSWDSVFGELLAKRKVETFVNCKKNEKVFRC